jgi:hypothetical protein
MPSSLKKAGRVLMADADPNIINLETENFPDTRYVPLWSGIHNQDASNGEIDSAR